MGDDRARGRYLLDRCTEGSCRGNVGFDHCSNTIFRNRGQIWRVVGLVPQATGIEHNRLTQFSAQFASRKHQILCLLVVDSNIQNISLERVEFRKLTGSKRVLRDLTPDQVPRNINLWKSCTQKMSLIMSQ